MVRHPTAWHDYPRHQQLESTSAGGEHPRPMNRNRCAAPCCSVIVAHGPGALHMGGEAMRPNMYVSVTIRCRCGFELRLCVPVGVAVPEPLRCSPGAPIGPP